MKRIQKDVPRWYVYLHRQVAGLPLADDGDGRERRFEDEVFARLFAGAKDCLNLPKVDAKDLTWVKAQKQAIKQAAGGSLNAIEKACRGDAKKSRQALVELFEKAFPKRLEPASGNARDLADGLSNTGLLDGGKSGAGGSWQGDAREDERAKKLAERLKNDERMKKIAALAGKFKRIALTKEKTRVKHGADEISNVIQGSDVSRLLPTELVRFASCHRVRRLAAFRDLLEGTCLEYEMTSVEPLGRGPLVLCVDKSPSMEGEKDIWATAVALALAETVHREHRTFVFLGFSDSVHTRAVVPPGRPIPEKVLFAPLQGGTNVECALDLALGAVESRSVMSRADIILVTDGESSTQNAESIRERALSKDVRIFGIGIGVPKENLEPWCNEVHVVTDLSRMDDETQAMFFDQATN